MKKLIIIILLLVCTACSSTIEKENGDIIYKKEFGTYIINNNWKESKKNNQYIYKKENDSIIIELVKNNYKSNEYLQLRQLIYTNLLKQAQYNNSQIYGSAFTTEKNYNVYEFIIKTESTINKQYYIIGNYKYILIQANISDKDNEEAINKIVKNIVNNFQWR